MERATLEVDQVVEPQIDPARHLQRALDSA